MPRRDASLVTLVDRLFCQQLERMPVRIVGFIDVHVDVGVGFFGDLEGDLNLPGGVVHVLLTVRHAADDLGAVFHCFPHIINRFRVPGQPPLREGDDLDIKESFYSVARR